MERKRNGKMKVWKVADIEMERFTFHETEIWMEDKIDANIGDRQRDR
jgi:hypothetical protein